jgi:Mrp family chromosome partitioning ATPase
MSFCYDDASRLPEPSFIEPARVQFIEREFSDLLNCATNAIASRDLLQQIHDALFLEGRSITSLRAELVGHNGPARILAITSGKGGVGKTTVSLNLGAALAQRGLRVLLFDADLGMANLHVFAGIRRAAHCRMSLKAARRFRKWRRLDRGNATDLRCLRGGGPGRSWHSQIEPTRQ